MIIEYIVKSTCKDFEQVPENGEIISINNEKILAICSKCHKPILRSDIHSFNNETNEFYCLNCIRSV